MVTENPVFNMLLQKKGLSNKQEQDLPIQEEIVAESPIVQKSNNPIFDIIKNKQKEPIINPDYPTTFGRGAALVGRGFLSEGIGGLADLASKYLAKPAMQSAANLAQKTRETWGEDIRKKVLKNPERPPEKTDKIYEKALEYVSNPKAQETIASVIDSLSGESLAPRNTKEKILHTTGAFLVPIPGTGYVKASKVGLGAVGKLLAKEASIAGGAATALQTPHLTQEGTAGRIGEDFVKVMLGASAGKKIHGKAEQTVRYANNLVKSGKYKEALANAGRGIMDFPEKMAGKTLATFSNPNAAVLKKAEKLGINLPYNIALNHKVHNFLANNVLKSTFTADVFKKTFRDADSRMLEEVNKSINTLGGSQLKPSEASLKFKDYLKQEQDFAHDQSRILYENAANFSKPTDTVVPKRTAEAIYRIKDMVQDAVDPAANSVAQIVSKISNKMGVGAPKELEEAILDYTDNPKLLMQLFDAFGDASRIPEIPTSKLINIRASLNRINYKDPNMTGIKSQLRSLTSAINKDIESTANPKFIQEWRKANDYYRNVDKQIFQSDLARSVTTGEAPTMAFDKLDSVDNIKFFEKMMNRTPESKQIFADIKKAKVVQLLEGAINGNLESGSLGTAAFSKKFNKNEKGQEVLEALLGSQEYSKLTDIADIAQQFSLAGRELLNTSGTAIAAHDIDAIKQAVKGTLNTLYSLGGAGAGFAAAGLPGAVAGFATPYVLSRVVSNPKIMSYAKSYALARQKRHEKQAEGILKKIIPMVEHEVKFVGINVLNEHNEEKK